jgi:nucleoside-diphosphate-sugar epimerase
VKKINIFCFGFGKVAKYFIRNISKKYDVNLAATSREETQKKKIFGIKYDCFKFINDEFDNRLLNQIKKYDHILISIPPKNGIDIVLKNFQKLLAASKINWITYLSATSVYGDHQGRWVDESSELNPSTKAGKSRLDAEKKWIEFCNNEKLPLRIFRLSGIYSQENNILKRIKSGLQKIVNKPNHFFSRIHIEDIANILEITLEKKIIKSGEICNLSDDYPCSNIEIANYAYNLMKMSKPKMIETNEIESEMLRDFYKDSKKVSNNKIKETLSYKLKFPTYKEGLNEIYDHFV